MNIFVGRSVMGRIHPSGQMRPAGHLNENRYRDKILQQVVISDYSRLELNCILRGKIPQSEFY